jgi:rubredoxin
MRIGWRARESERTCADCGYIWHVPRSATRRGISAFAMAPRGSYRPWSGSEPEIAASMAVGEVAEAYRHCPECGSERYTQQPLRR